MIEYLDGDETVAEYLEAMLEGPNPDVFLAAPGVELAVVPELKERPVQR